MLINNKAKQLLILGKIPPPIGGVTIHVKRLLKLIQGEGIVCDFFDLNKFKLFNFLRKMFNSEIAHCHSNNRLFLFLFSLTGIIFKTKTIITIHGNVKSLNKFYNFFEMLSIRFCYIPIVLNDKSYSYALKQNKRSVIISSFLPPLKSDLYLSENILLEIENLKNNYNHIFSTNASDYAFDKNGIEIYGILKLVDIFKELTHLGIVISDPTGEYFKRLKGKLTPNILIIPYPHSFSGILTHTDSFIRATTTDGDSISIKEALYFKKNVISSNCVNRPNGVITYETDNYEQLREIILSTMNNKKSYYNSQLNGFTDLFKIYQIT